MAPKSTKVVQRRSRQLDEINFDTLVGIENIFEEFLENVNSVSILDVVRESVSFWGSKTGE